ncbi:MAG: Asp-tRNA(Asn)/Glu-tRNA(Gln) amidotransferase subunit GatA [Epsilonproteobacteria bacterium]|nr:Asp-tRNA(Asn)/Glu-tRNA(Gln) amidotransferase subunit GatA [Campylobacterota bacterium]
MNPFSTIREIKEKLEKKEVSKKEVFSFYLERIKKYNPELNAVLEVFEDLSADDIESSQGLLAGIPMLVKDNICQKGRLTSAGSNILSNYRAPYNATVIERLNAEGARSLGRTNMDEFAMGGTGAFSAYGIAKNPWNLNRTPGGSSSGSAAAVGAGLAPFALGSETGGSIRQPAAFNNLVGMYPTYGSHSRYGVIAFGSSLDQVGAITRDVYDSALIASIFSGHDPHDQSSLVTDKKDYTKALDGKLPENLKVGIIKDALEYEQIEGEVRAAFDESVNQLKAMGAKIKSVELPDLKHGTALYFIVSRMEAASNLHRFDGSLYGNRCEQADNLIDMYVRTRHDGMGAEVKRRILTGTYLLSSEHKTFYYELALHIRRMIRAEFENAFNDVDVLISPTTPTLAYRFDNMPSDPVLLYLADYFTTPNCMIGTPAISVPGGFSPEGLPIGVQFLGPRLSEQLLLKVAYAFEQHTNYGQKTPKGFE